MPKSNARYPFEYKALEKVGELGIRLFGEDRTEPGFILEIDNHGQLRKTVSAVQNPDFLELDKEFLNYIVFDVFDHGAYIYLSWKNIKENQFQALLGVDFSDGDFVGFGSTSGKRFPTSHSVMF